LLLLFFFGGSAFFWEKRFEVHLEFESEIVGKVYFYVGIKELFLFREFRRLTAIPQSFQYIGYLLENSLDAEDLLSRFYGGLFYGDFTELDAEHILHLFPSHSVRSGNQKAGAIGNTKSEISNCLFDA